MHRYGTRAPPKERYVAAIITPASPQYVVGAADNGDDVEFDGAAPPPVIGVVSTGAVGHTLIAVEPDLRRVTVTEGLTSESAAARLAAGGLAPPLYVHSSMDAGHAGRSTGVAGQTRRLRLEVGNILSAGTNDGDYSKQRYDGKDPVQGLLNLVKREYGMTVDQSFEFVGINGGRDAAASKRPRPFPLTLSTAQQPACCQPGVCLRSSHALPTSSGAPAGCRAYIQELLLHPPPRDTAAAISEACVLMSTGLSPSDGGVPRLEVVPPQKITKLLWKKEATHVFFSEISAMASAVRRTLEHDSNVVRRAGELLLNPTALKTGRNVTKESLVKAARKPRKSLELAAEEVLDKGDWKPRAQVATSIDVDAEVDDDEYNELDGETEADLEALLGLDAPRRLIMCPDSFFESTSQAWPCSSR